jgi:hypothetical protein
LVARHIELRELSKPGIRVNTALRRAPLIRRNRNSNYACYTVVFINGHLTAINIDI